MLKIGDVVSNTISDELHVVMDVDQDGWVQVSKRGITWYPPNTFRKWSRT